MANLRVGRRSGFVTRGGRSRRESLWLFLSPVNFVLAAASQAVITNSLNAGALALRPFTVVRSRLQWFVKSDQTGALERYQTAWGAAVVSDQANAIGVTAVPTPFTDLGSDLWFMHSVIAGSFTFVTGSGFHPVGGTMKEIDSKAMRRVNDDQDLVFVAENSSISLGTDHMVSGRILVKLH